MNIDEISNEALRLDSRDRATLAQIIWESLEEPFQKSEELTDQQAIELSKQREDEIASGQVTPISHQDLMTRLRNEN